MPLPNFNAAGDLPAGIHRASLDEVLAHFGVGSARRQAAAASLVQISRLAQGTDALLRLLVFGSFVTSKPDPRDVDIILIMRDDFNVNACNEETGSLFNHSQAGERFKASVFWIRPGLLVNDSLTEFVAHWQTKRDGTKRGIVEIVV